MSNAVKITLCVAAALVIATPTSGANAVQNADFSGGTAPWSFFSNGAHAFNVIGGEAQVVVTLEGTNVQLFQTPISLPGSTLCKLTFRARNTQGHDVRVALFKHTSPYTTYGLSQDVDITETMTGHMAYFTTTEGAKTDARLMFYVAPFDRNGDVYYFDDVVLTPACGDGILDAIAGETCDDGNDTSGDGCSADCRRDGCGDGVIQPGLGEECDDGNAIGGDGCSATCAPEYCGDAVVQSGLGESCDDGNATSGDGCSSACVLEGFVGPPGPTGPTGPPGPPGPTGCACEIGDFVGCYSGPPETLRVGPCRAGRRWCESAGGTFGACIGQVLPSAEACDGLDNDCDGTVDEDFDLLSDRTNCGACRHICAEPAACVGGTCRTGSELDCTNGVDDDLDGAVDCADSDCASSPGCTTEVSCNDGIDNDGDARIDCDDPDCCDTCGTCPETLCGDGLDNDADMLVDCDDPDCVDRADCCTPSAEACDGEDNDCDGTVDEDFDLTSDRANCGACGRVCASYETCVGGVCRSGGTCGNGEQDSGETDVDCGGPACAGCADGRSCVEARDCTSGLCAGGVCQPRPCDTCGYDEDPGREHAESFYYYVSYDRPAGATAAHWRVRHGGLDPYTIPVPDVCWDAHPDRLELRLYSNSNDGAGHAVSWPECHNGTEWIAVGQQAVSDYGGWGEDSPPTQMTDGDWNTHSVWNEIGPISSSWQTAHSNAAARWYEEGMWFAVSSGTCTDGTTNGTETDLDCGGSCAPCGDGLSCLVAGDCHSAVCYAGTCQPPDCSDATKNGEETDVDCGGSCPPCSGGNSCDTESDCASASCASGTCTDQSCLEIKSRDMTAMDGVYTIAAPGVASFGVYCDMTTDGGGWTLVMKVDGNSTILGYDSPFWTNNSTYHETSTALDTAQAKLKSYGTVPFTAVRVGMTDGGITRWLTLESAANSMFELMSPGAYVATAAGRNAWKGLLASSSLQVNCNREGFNNVCTDQRVRVGIVGNNDNDCNSCDSRLGIGASGAQCGTDTNNACGNEAGCDSDNGDAHARTFGYILVR